ncbi:ATP-binding protein [Streptomyces sp. NPDC054940]
MSSRDHIDFRGGTFHGPTAGKVEIHHHAQAPFPTATSALPPPPAAFTGRDEMVRDLLAALDPNGDAAPGAVLISAVGGLGGVGKTALALHVAHAARARFPGGTLFVNMRGYDESPVAPEEAASTFLRAFGVRDEHLPAAPEERYSLYRSVLDARESVLIVLDNVSESGQVVPLLPGNTRHRVLVTSRASLDSLTARSIHLNALAQDEAVDLIDRSLRARTPSDSRVHDEPNAVRRLVTLCGGLPLALHIAAALLHRRRPRPISTLVEELQVAADRVRILSAPGEDQYGTQLALRPVFDVTYQRLDADQARLFRLLGQAPTSDFGVEIALALSDLPSAELRQKLDDLAAAFLITPSPDGSRWDMHDLLRTYASSVSAGEQPLKEEAVKGRNRLLCRFFVRAASADKRLKGLQLENMPDFFADRDAALEWLSTEHTSLVGAVLWAEKAEHSRFATRLGLCLDRYLHLQRHFTDAALVSETTILTARRDHDQRLEMFSLTTSGNARHKLHQYREAATAHTRALRLAYALGDRGSQAAGWTNLGQCMHEWGQYDIAAQMHSHARELFSKLGDFHSEAMAWNNLGIPLVELHRFDEAAQAHSNAQRIFSDLEDRQREATAWLNLGTALRGRSDLDNSANSYMKAAELFAEQRDQHGEASAWFNVGLLLAELQEFETAVQAFRKCDAGYVTLGLWYDVGKVRWNIARLCEEQGKDAEAKAAWIAAAEAYERAGAPEEAAKARRNAQS